MTLDRRLQTYDHQSLSLNVEPGVENKQCIQRLIGRAHWDNLVQCHGQLWRQEDRACTRLTQARAANEVYRAADQIRVSADQNGRQDALLHLSPARVTVSQQSVTVVNPADEEAVDRRPCYVEWQQFQWALNPTQLVKPVTGHAK